MARRRNAGRMYRASSKYSGEAKKRGSKRTEVVAYDISEVRAGSTRGGFEYLGKQSRLTSQGQRDVFVVVTPSGTEKHYYLESNAFARFNRI